MVTLQHWAYLTSSRHQSLVSRHQDSVLGLSPITPSPAMSSTVIGAGDTMTYVDSRAALFSHLPSIFIALHLLYEDTKLSHIPVEEVEDVACLLHMLATYVLSLYTVAVYNRLGLSFSLFLKLSAYILLDEFCSLRVLQ
jgi:hypothetical protein